MLSEIIISRTLKNQAIEDYLRALATGSAAVLEAPRSIRSAIVAGASGKLQRPILVITSHQELALRFREEIGGLLGARQVKLFMPNEIMPYEKLTPNPEIISKRFEAIHHLRHASNSIVISPINAVIQLLPSNEILPIDPIILRRGGDRSREELTSDLIKFGYERDYVISKRGQISVRGDILDIFPGNFEYPVRIEFFGDTIDSIRTFNLESQVSVKQLEEVGIFAIRGYSQLSSLAPRVKRLEKKYPGLALELEKISSGEFFPGIESYWPLFSKDQSLFETLPPETAIFLDEPPMLALQADKFAYSWTEHIARKETAEGLPAMDYLANWPNLRSSWKGLMATLSSAPEHTDSQRFKVNADGFESLFGRVNELGSIVREVVSTGARTIIAVETPGRSRRIKEILAEEEIFAVEDEESFGSGSLMVCQLPWTQGFWLKDAKFALISENDIFRKAFRYRQDRQTRSTKPLVTPFDVAPGDYVVHVDAGIGIFRGLTTKTVMGSTREYMDIEYAKGDRLFVPLEQLDRVQRYVGMGKTPVVTRLSGKDWQKAKSRAQRSVKKLAFSLIELYADRLKAKKVPYSQDTVWQRELEDSFPFTETPDQETAIIETKNDLQSIVPMDRLICGDVGYGKTEVALRAAFKVVVDGRQVAVLVPTTILAEQHFRTFLDRLSPFPVKIALLSRFVDKKVQEQAVAEITAGKVDIVIGTHRLLQNDIRFKDLGLIIIDEEQRFGVSHKEKIKDLRRNIDVLTLSATPIPRTLQMALSGIRDLSIINTPPDDRLPVTTYVGSYSEDIIIDAIRRELSRDGQVFYIHNRVTTIDAAAEHLRALVPEAAIAVAHGQMHEHSLERTMKDFLGGKTNVLACTTIIESGIDIPSANTLIVERASKLGLSQLYQLRGRVGRAHQQAYAYFFVHNQERMTYNAERRLHAIGEFTELGSGFKVAMQDLEIRGAGDLLGAEQSGNIEAVGFELYSQLLHEEVEGRKGNVAALSADIRIDLPADAYLPADYIESESARVETYQMIMTAAKASDVKGIRDGLRDRFGSLPDPARQLFIIAEIRVAAKQAGIEQVAKEGERVRMRPITMPEEKRLKMQQRFTDIGMGFSATTLYFRKPDNDILYLVKEILDAIIIEAS